MIVERGKWRIVFHSADESVGVTQWSAGFQLEHNYGTGEKPEWFLACGADGLQDGDRAWLRDTAEEIALALFKLVRFCNAQAP